MYERIILKYRVESSDAALQFPRLPKVSVFLIKHNVQLRSKTTSVLSRCVVELKRQL